MSNGSSRSRQRLSRGDRRRNERLARLRAVVTRDSAVLAFDLAADKQVCALTGHRWRLLDQIAAEHLRVRHAPDDDQLDLAAREGDAPDGVLPLQLQVELPLLAIGCHRAGDVDRAGGLERVESLGGDLRTGLALQRAARFGGGGSRDVDHRIGARDTVDHAGRPRTRAMINSGGGPFSALPSRGWVPRCSPAAPPCPPSARR